MPNNALRTLSDQQLLAEVKLAAANARSSTAALVALLAVLDERQLYLAEGCSSPFIYCTRVLRLSEHAAYGRIAAARAARRCPAILDLLASGEINLTTVVLIAPYLSPENHEALLGGVRHKSKSEVEHLIACVYRQPDIKSQVRRVPVPTPPAAVSVEPSIIPALDLTTTHVAAPPAMAAAPRATVAPLAPERYLIKVTVSKDAHDNLKRVQDLLRHVIPTGDPAAIIERALATLVAQLEKTKCAQVRTPRATKPAHNEKSSRHVPASVRRAVWNRDGGRCAFVGTEGRCAETGFVEFHHLEPYAHGGPTTIENLSLRCRAHNGHEAVVHFGQSLRRTGSVWESGARRLEVARCAKHETDAEGAQVSSATCVGQRRLAE